jgi:hypothetical protein
VDDPYIIPVYEAGEAGGVLFIAMRLVRGGDPRLVLVREGMLAPGRVARLISPVGGTLALRRRTAPTTRTCCGTCDGRAVRRALALSTLDWHLSPALGCAKFRSAGRPGAVAGSLGTGPSCLGGAGSKTPVFS